MFSEYLDHLRASGKRYFTFQQVIKELDISVDGAKSGLYRLRHDGKIITPAKGLYVIVPPEHQPSGSIPAEELVPILMHYLQADYYVSLLSGAQYYGASHQKPQRFQIVTNKRIKHPLEFGHIKLEIIYKKSLAGLPIENRVVNTGYLKIATPELIALDLLTYPIHSGGLNHTATILSELIEAIDADKLITLAAMIGEKAWVQRLGFILEKIDVMDEKKLMQLTSTLQRYIEGRISAFVPLASELPRAGYPRISKWLIIENTDIQADI